jgi:hypothetical protein
MYGNILKAGEKNHEVFQYGVPIPIEHLNDNDMMSKIRYCVRYNCDLPGNIEDVHPNKFIASNLKI